MAGRRLAVEGSPPPPSWRLAPDVAAVTQGLVVSPFGHLEASLALFLTLPDGTGGGWLKALRAVVSITDAGGKTSPCAAIAFTCQGLAKMGLSQETLATFSTPFTEGMFHPDRRRRLGDEGDLVVQDGPLWSGGDPKADGTPTTVHALLMLYGDDEAAVGQMAAAVRPVLDAEQVTVAREVAMSLRYDDDGVAREHFGFADGISQPVPYGDSVLTAGGAPMDSKHKDPWHGIEAGDILIGHVNAHGEPAPGPVVKLDPRRPLSMLPPMADTPGFGDLGRNGSYLVVRELRQDVAGFWTSMDTAAAALADRKIDATGLAQRVVGRTLDGDPLSPAGPMPPMGGQPANSFGYRINDPHGLGCPMGAHARRANPRDSLAEKPGWAPTLLQAANNHRLLRRGRKYGPAVSDPRVDDGQDRGLMFICLNSDLARQFEFVQQTWLLSPTFSVLYDESDPLVGPAGSFTIPDTPIRRRAHVESYVKLVGGAYFFLPSLPALDFLGALP